MGLSYHFSFRAPGTITSSELTKFLRGVEGDAKLMGFAPTIVVEGPFDTPERREFARRVARPLTVEDERLKGVDFPLHLCWTILPSEGVCRLAPEYGVILVVADNRGYETVFGFLRYPRSIRDRGGRLIMPVAEAGDRSMGNLVDSPDPRYREIVRRFSDAGYLASEHDEFAQRHDR